MKSYIFPAIFLLALGAGSRVGAQQVVKARGEARIKIENHQTYDEARMQVRELAMINAIENTFGTYVEQETNIDIENGQTDFKIIGNIKVKGEWLETLDEQFTEDIQSRPNPDGRGEVYERWITCRIQGRVREITRAGVEFKAQTLNCPRLLCRTTTYLDGEQFYLHFVSPADGYLSVYMAEADRVFRLLPYAGMSGRYLDAVPVEADREYIFFAPGPDYDYFPDFPVSRIDELLMTTSAGREYLKLYVVFSPVPYRKPVLKDPEVNEDEILPRSLTGRQFDQWLARNRVAGSGFIYKVINLQIREK